MLRICGSPDSTSHAYLSGGNVRASCRILSACASVWLACGAASAAGISVSADTYVSTSSPGTNYGTATLINVGAGNSALIQFDLSSLPSGLTAANIGKATVTFYVNSASVPGSVDV